MAAKQQDTHQRAKECYSDLKELWAPNHQRMLEDLRFSNPVNPEQWSNDDKRLRQGRPCLTLDRTGQYRVQIVNSGRMSKPGINCMPADSGADVAVAEAFDGIIRHIEYRSRAQIAYDWALEGAAGPGIGWIRVVPRVVDPRTNQQEICIERVADHLSCMVDGDQPDGSDAMNGFAETLIPKKRFQKLYPKATTQSWDGNEYGSWVVADMVRVCEWQYVEETAITMLVVQDPSTGEELHLTEEEFAELAANIGYQPPFRSYEAKDRKVKWCKFNGAEVLEETTFPGHLIGIVPVIGYESFVEGQRYICGATRRLMEGQKAYNFERSAELESMAMQPKAPLMVPAEGIEGHETHYENLNSGQPAYLPYNALDSEGRQIPPPQRVSPPQFPAAFAQASLQAIGDMEAALGMTQAVLGMDNQATSGRQERERRQQGQVSTFHFMDNRDRSVEQIGRIVVGMIPSIYDTPRQAKILGIDGQQGSVQIDPAMQQPAIKKGRKVVAINPNAGRYDVRVKSGPAYTTQQQDAADGMREALNSAPLAAPVLLPAIVKAQDWPDSERIARGLKALAPPEIRAAMGDDEDEEAEQIPLQAQQQLQQQSAMLEQMAQAMQQAQAEIQRLQAEAESKEADRLARLQEAEIAAAGKVREKEIEVAGNVQTAAIEAEGQAAIAQLTQPADAPQPDASVMPALEALQQQMAQLAAVVAAPRIEVPMVIEHERDPISGLVIRSVERPMVQ